MYTRKFKINLLFFLLLIPLVIVLQYFILKPHLRYGFADVDWNFLLSFKEFSSLYNDPYSHLLNAWRVWGVYIYQVYYIGLIENFFGMDYQNFQVITHIFKIIATLSIYPIIFLVTKSKLAAFLTTIIYAVAYASVGVLYTVVTSGLFAAIPFMSLFFVWYFYLIQKGKNSIWDVTVWMILFVITLLLATERMYPLIPVVLLIEFFWWFKNDYSRVVFFWGLRRLTPLIVLLVGALLYQSKAFIVMTGNLGITYQKLMLGNWQVLLSPIISLGGLFLPKDYWRILGEPNINGIFAYFRFLLGGPMIIFSSLSIFLSIFLAKRKIKFILNILILTLILALMIYVLATHHLSIPTSDRMHFDFGYIIPALIGSYTISITLVLFKEWLNSGKRDILLISTVGGITLSFLFIITTWIVADWVLVFFGVHRYLTIPAIGLSLFMAGLITIVFNKLRENKLTKSLSYVIFLLIIPIIMFNAKVISDYFKYELEFVGTDAAEHIRMKNKLWSYLTNFSNLEPSVFYFDESFDHDNGYFDETTIMAGFNFWMRFRGNKIVDGKLTPALIRSNLLCQEQRSTCLSKVKEFVTIQNGLKGILYGGIFYKPANFYAFRFINRDIVDIREEVVKIIGLE